MHGATRQIRVSLKGSNAAFIPCIGPIIPLFTSNRGIYAVNKRMYTVNMGMKIRDMRMYGA